MIEKPEEQAAYYQALEDRCQHFEETINSTADLLRGIIQDFETPVLGSMLDPIIERLHSIVVFLEATSTGLPENSNHPHLIKKQ
jgi:hypothetical protein